MDEIDIFELSIRAGNALKKAGVKTLKQIYSMSRSDIAALPNIGDKTVDEIEQALLCDDVWWADRYKADARRLNEEEIIIKNDMAQIRKERRLYKGLVELVAKRKLSKPDLNK